LIGQFKVVEACVTHSCQVVRISVLFDVPKGDYLST